MKILMHLCCAPCAVYPFSKLREEFEEVMGFWYNPNIHPLVEYRKRLEAVKIWAEKEKIRVIYENEYGLRKFLRQVVYREERRCFFCYQMRLEKTAIFARRGKFDYFGSTLLFSPHQNQKIFREIIEELSKKYKVKPYLKQGKEWHKKSMELSKKMGLYHQQYCGCIYSEEERYKNENR
ncbi:epoxyqueuosine reductase QueH [Candidatus Aerophobetes bacterium]|nr:epoxyqueuosine reductase QueH [Candidatus Aerophobetes bacterium]